MNLQEAIVHLQRDRHLSRIISSVDKPDFTPSDNLYYDLLESIVSQQLSVKAASTIFNRFIDLFPDRNPQPHLLTDISFDRLRAAGLSAQKASYIQNVAVFALRNNMNNITWKNMSDDEIIQLLTQIKGVGSWTVQMLLIFSLNRTDVFPVDDLGIQQAMIRLYNLDKKDKTLKKQMLELSEPWRPWRTVASRYLWRWKDSDIAD